MDCTQWQALLDAHLDGTLNEQQEQAFTEHLNTCGQCRHLYTVRMDCLQLDETAQVPELFAHSWRQNLKREEDGIMEQTTPPSPKRRLNTRTWLRGLSIAAALLLVVGGSLTLGRRLGTGTPQADSQTESYSAPYSRSAGSALQSNDSAMPAVPMDVSAEAAPAPTKTEKIIRTVSLSLTTRQFEDDLAKIQSNLTDLGGYVENSDLSADARARRYASLRLRVPVEKLDGFLEDLQGIGYLVSMSESAEDVSEQYLDVETRLITQKAKMERLQALLEKAGSVEDLLQIETEIANTQYQLDSLTGALRGYDSKVNYATVWLTLNEETIPTTQGEPTLGERIRAALSDSWTSVKAFLADAAVFLVVLLPYAAVLAIVIYVVIRIVKNRRKKA